MWSSRGKHAINRVAYETGVKSSREYFQKRGDIETDLMVHQHRIEAHRITSQTRNLQKLDKSDSRILTVQINNLEKKVNTCKKMFQKTHAEESEGIHKQPSSKTIAEQIWAQTRELDILRKQLHLCNNNVEFVKNTASLRKHQLQMRSHAHIGKIAVDGCTPTSQLQYEKDQMNAEMYREDINGRLDEIFDDDQYTGEGGEESKDKFMTSLYVELLGNSETSSLPSDTKVSPPQTPVRRMQPDLSASAVSPALRQPSLESIDDQLMRRLEALKVCTNPPNE